MLKALLGKPAIWWVNNRNRLTDSIGLRWLVDAQGRLCFDGCYHPPFNPMSKRQLEAALQRLFDKIKASGLPITLEVIYIEEHIATGLYDERSITEKHLRSADRRYDGITFEMELLGELRLVSIQKTTHYPDYEFIVRGHPSLVRVRDTIDFLGVMTGEAAF